MHKSVLPALWTIFSVEIAANATAWFICVPCHLYASWRGWMLELDGQFIQPIVAKRRRGDVYIEVKYPGDCISSIGSTCILSRVRVWLLSHFHIDWAYFSNSHCIPTHGAGMYISDEKVPTETAIAFSTTQTILSPSTSPSPPTPCCRCHPSTHPIDCCPALCSSKQPHNRSWPHCVVQCVRRTRLGYCSPLLMDPMWIIEWLTQLIRLSLASTKALLMHRIRTRVELSQGENHFTKRHLLSFSYWN